MRHGDKINNLGRTASHRKALLSNLSCQLIEHKRIVTTLAKAKALRTHIEPLITKAKNNTTHHRRLVFSYLQDKVAVTELFSTIADKIGSRPGGYTRIIKIGRRPGDTAEMAFLEFVDYDFEAKGQATEAKAAKAEPKAAAKTATKAKKASTKLVAAKKKSVKKTQKKARAAARA